MSSFKFYSFVIFHHRDYKRKARSRPNKKNKKKDFEKSNKLDNG